MGSSNIHRHPLNDNFDQWHISYNIMAYKLLKIKRFTSVNFQINRLMLGVPKSSVKDIITALTSLFTNDNLSFP